MALAAGHHQKHQDARARVPARRQRDNDERGVRHGEPVHYRPTHEYDARTSGKGEAWRVSLRSGTARLPQQHPHEAHRREPEGGRHYSSLVRALRRGEQPS